MTKRALATTTAAPRVIHYIQPTTPTTGAELLLHTAAHLAAQRHERELAYARWATRQAAIAERDRRTRRIMLRVLAVVALVVLAACSGLGWMAYRVITAATLSGAAMVGGVIVAALLVAGLVVGGQRCITVVEHRH
ncbi:MAG TPA: hypothetical protein VK453_13945 [Micromonosporaceae bacterium]|nr:hypothetical protein [Micromonosporaceae bacterium]